MKIIKIDSAYITYYSAHNHITLHYNRNEYGENRKFLLGITEKAYEYLKNNPGYTTSLGMGERYAVPNIWVVINKQSKKAYICNENADMFNIKWTDATFEEELIFNAINKQD